VPPLEQVLGSAAVITRFFPGARDELAAIDEAIVSGALGPHASRKAHCFEDQYASTGGQLYELMAGHESFHCGRSTAPSSRSGQTRAAPGAHLPSIRHLLRAHRGGEWRDRHRSLRSAARCPVECGRRRGMGWVRQRTHPRADRTALAAGASRARIDRRRTCQPIVMGMVARSDADANATAGLAAFADTLRERRRFERGAQVASEGAHGPLDPRASTGRDIPRPAAGLGRRCPPPAWRVDVRISRELRTLWFGIDGNRSPRCTRACPRAGCRVIWREDHRTRQRRDSRRGRAARGLARDRPHR